jgi:stage III sporulation protein AE
VLALADTQAEDTTAAQIDGAILEQLEHLDLEALESYIKSLEGFQSKNLKQILQEYVAGGGLGADSFLQDILGMVFSNVKNLLPSFVCIAAIGLLCGILNSLQSRYIGESTAKVVFFIAYLGALLPTLGILTEAISLGKGAVRSMQQQMQLVFPIMLTLIAASGGSVSAAIFQPAVGFLCNTLIELVDGVVFPITVAIIIFSMAGKVFGELKTEKFCSFFKSINKWIIGIGVSVFGLFFTVQGITAATYDGIVRRAAKYAIGTGVPIIGGFLSGGFDLAIAGSVLIKNALGNFSLVLLVMILLRPLSVLIASNVLLRLSAAITHPFGDSKIASFLEETAENLQFCTAGVLFSAFLYFIAILIMVFASGMFV